LKRLPWSGTWTGKPCEIVNVKPFSKKSMPSVVTNDGTLRTTVTKPLMRPTAAHAIRATITPTMSGRPASQVKYMMNEARAKTLPTERSISPQIISITSPAAMMAVTAVN
jgi:hypothetical protein